MVYKFFNKNSKGGGIKNQITQNQQLAEELKNLLLENFKKEEFILLLKSIFGVVI